MAKRQSHIEKGDKIEGVASSDAAGGASPMDKFKSIAKRIIGVPREEYNNAERRYQEKRGVKR
jgi:hypothetical protein